MGGGVGNRIQWAVRWERQRELAPLAKQGAQRSSVSCTPVRVCVVLCLCCVVCKLPLVLGDGAHAGAGLADMGACGVAVTGLSLVH